MNHRIRRIAASLSVAAVMAASVAGITTVAITAADAASRPPVGSVCTLRHSNGEFEAAYTYLNPNYENGSHIAVSNEGVRKSMDVVMAYRECRSAVHDWK